jgi:hypothetical protein
MRAEQLVKSLQRLNLKPSSKHAATALGVSVRQLQRMTAGHVPVPRPVALLTISYLKHGVPNPLWNPELEKIDALKEAATKLGKLHADMKRIETTAPKSAAIVTVKTPEPELPKPIRSRTRRPAGLSKAYIEEIADRAERKTAPPRSS